MDDNLYKDLHPNLKLMIPMVEGIAKTIGAHCEVALHDFSKLPDSIVAIANGHISGRTIGNPQTEHSLNIIKQKRKSKENFIHYSSKTPDGKILTSSSFFIRDEEGEAIGVFCINIDVTAIKATQIILESMLGEGKAVTMHNTNNQKMRSNNICDIMERIVNQVISNSKTPIAYLSKEQKIEIIKNLDSQGIFLIRNSVNYVAEILCVSRYTIYNYLDSIKSYKNRKEN